jgi:hypothetical protein
MEFLGPAALELAKFSTAMSKIEPLIVGKFEDVLIEPSMLAQRLIQDPKANCDPSADFKVKLAHILGDAALAPDYKTLPNKKTQTLVILQAFRAARQSRPASSKSLSGI